MRVVWGTVSVEHDDPTVAWGTLYDTIEHQWTTEDTVYNIPSLEQARAVVLAHIDERIAVLRAAYIARIPGQEAAYQTKLEQARSYLALDSAKDASPDKYPALFGEEAAERKLNPVDMAVLIVTASERWQKASDRIDAVALRVRLAVFVAKTMHDMFVALHALPIEVLS